ncbi:FMN-dependent NADH-azoreductase [Neptunicella sp. SCSIO 80796]|uniref:FMN-dependent NADH-azoreductase n=1 Tax=Neptunicella plasticusilytica TaxID=3117012 RepID=UPI003A4E4373
MTTILRIDASVRQADTSSNKHTSISKSLANTFIQQWQQFDNQVKVIHRDLAKQPVGFIDQDWLSAVFTPENKRSDAQHKLLSLSDTLIDELTQADLILISSPMYNYGMPASLKAWFDQVIRVNKTFSFDLKRGDFPLEPILSGKQMVLLTSTGEFGFEKGGIREHMNHLSPHVRTLGHYLGTESFHEVRAEYQEFGDQRHQQSVETAFANTARLAELLCGKDKQALDITSMFG